MASSKRPFKIFVVEELGAFPQFLLWAIFEWILIATLYIDGFLAFLSTTLAKIFELEPPCVLCTRLDHALVGKNPNTFYNDSICECHKKDISSLAYCHRHGKLADFQTMCDGCLLPFSGEKDSNNHTNKSLLFVEDYAKCDDRCSCCGEPLKTKASSKGYDGSFWKATSSPRTCFVPTASKTEDLEYTEVKFLSDNESDMADDKRVREAMKPDYEEMNDEFLFWDSTPKKLASFEKSDLGLEKNDEAPGDGDSSLENLKKQACIDRKTILSLSMELEEERSAAAVAANNSMAMITRLQSEKAAVQMESLQYQRMMEEQAEYDQETIQMLNDLLTKKNEQVKVMESELEIYREKYGELRKVGSEECEVDADDYYHEWRSQSLSSFSEKSESDQSPLERDYHDPRSPSGSHFQNDEDGESSSGRSVETEKETDDSSFDFEAEKHRIYSMLKNLENHIQSSSMEDEDKDTVQENRVSLKREVSLIGERLRVLEADSEFLKHTAMTLQKGEKGAQLVIEIAQHLRKMRREDMISTADA